MKDVEGIMSHEETLRSAKILIVDDQEDNVDLLERMLRRGGYAHFKNTTDSRQVISIFREFQPDLILLDLMMPQMDGFAVMDGLRPLIPAGAYLPILVLTADVTPETKRRALSGGATDFLTKPLDATEVRLRVKNLLQARFLHVELQRQNESLEEKVHSARSSSLSPRKRFA